MGGVDDDITYETIIPPRLEAMILERREKKRKPPAERVEQGFDQYGAVALLAIVVVVGLVLVVNIITASIGLSMSGQGWMRVFGLVRT